MAFDTWQMFNKSLEAGWMAEWVNEWTLGLGWAEEWGEVAEEKAALYVEAAGVSQPRAQISPASLSCFPVFKSQHGYWFLGVEFGEGRGKVLFNHISRAQAAVLQGWRREPDNILIQFYPMKWIFSCVHFKQCLYHTCLWGRQFIFSKNCY